MIKYHHSIKKCPGTAEVGLFCCEVSPTFALIIPWNHPRPFRAHHPLTLFPFRTRSSDTIPPTGRFLLPHFSCSFFVAYHPLAQSPQFPPLHSPILARCLLPSNRQPQKPGTVRVCQRRLPSFPEDCPRACALIR